MVNQSTGKDDAPFGLQEILLDRFTSADGVPLVNALCAARGYDVRSLLANQFIMSRFPCDLPLNRRRALGVHIGFGDHLDFARLVINDVVVAVFVGKGFTRFGQILDDFEIRPSGTTFDLQKVVENWIADISGNFVILAKFGEHRFIYTDPTGTIGAVHDPVTSTVASTLFLALRRTFVPNPVMTNLPQPLFEQTPILGQTHDAVAQRLNPSARLNWDTNQQERIWPNSASEILGSPKAAVNTLRIEAQKIADAMPDNALNIALSGGVDSRIVGSFFHKRSGAKYFSHINNYANRLDAELARWVTQSMGKPLDVYRRKDTRPEPNVEEKFFIASGGCIKCPAEYANGVVNLMPAHQVILRGQQIDLLRAVQTIKPKDDWHDWWRIKELLPVERAEWRRNVFYQYQRIFAGWYESATDYMEDRLPDLDLIELYNPANNGARFPGLWRNLYVSLFNNRRLIDFILILGLEERKTMRPVFQILQANCPEVVDVPFLFEITKGSLDHLINRSKDFGVYAQKYQPRVA